MEERIERDLVRQKTSIIVMICIVVMVGMIGFTYSFFAAEISSKSGEITGEVATPELNITVQKVAPVSPNNNKKLIPQLDSAITKAVLGTQGKCVDDNTNAVCQVYKITLKNVGASSINVDGVVELNNGNNPNLKWARISGDGTNSVEPTVIDGIKEAEETTLTINELYTKGETKEYYIVVWISETGYAQMDRGTFTGTVRFNNHNELASSPALTTLTSLGLTQYVKTNTPDFTKINYSEEDEKIYQNELKGEIDAVTYYCTNELGYNNLETCLAEDDEFGMTLDELIMEVLGPRWFNQEDDNGIYATEDDQGTSYYFRGNVTNNYVKFGKYTEDAYVLYDETTGTSSYANSCGDVPSYNCLQIGAAGDDMYWRIVRINGDGSIRMVYDGTSPHANNVASENRQIGGSAFNKNYNDHAYVGYMYGQIGASTYDATHANINDSSIKTTIDRWYLKYLNTNYGRYVANAIYCNDRKISTNISNYEKIGVSQVGNGVGSSDTMYGIWSRINLNSNNMLAEANPSLKCEQVNDRFTLQGEVIETTDGLGGNQDLTYPVGLITADETILAGGTLQENANYYLHTGNSFWTSSTSFFAGGSALAFMVGFGGEAPSNSFVYIGNSVRPVISLESEVLKYGTGTTTDPFSIQENTTSQTTLTHLQSLGFDGTVSEEEPTTLLTGATTDEGLFAREDNQGTSYYFRGAVTNNYVKFGKYTEDAYAIYDSTTGTSSYATSCGDSTGCTQIASANDDMYWRIVRINGDGSIRMIYDGTSPHANGTSSTNRQIGESMFNKKYTDNAYVGYMYGQTGASSYDATHANTNDSSVKITIDRWYSKYLNTSYGRYISNAIYCNDRKIVTDVNKYKKFFGEQFSTLPKDGIGTSVTMYGTFNRMNINEDYQISEANPSLKCEQVNDRFTIQGETIITIDGLGGNQDLTYSVGLITADETLLAGGVPLISNNNYYLYTGNIYFTGSAGRYFGSNGASTLSVYADGGAPWNGVVNSYSGVRPVISIKPDAIKFGDGTSGNPFRMEQ